MVKQVVKFKKLQGKQLIDLIHEIEGNRKIIRQKVFENNGLTPSQQSQLAVEAKSGFNREETVERLMRLGFSNAVVEKAMNAAGNNETEARKNLLASQSIAEVQDFSTNLATDLQDIKEQLRLSY